MTALKQFSGLDAAHLPPGPLHLAIGMFDGVHLGHRAVIETAVQSAKESGGVSAVLTFWPHPSALFRSSEPTRLIMSPDAKARVLSRLGIDALVTQEFTKAFAGIAAEEFIPTLQRHLPQLAAIYVGENWRFGKGRTGDVALLLREARKAKLSVISVPRVNFDGDPISSTRIRQKIENGAIEQANALLGYAYFAEGLIAPGKGLGRQIGFPTLNVDWAPDLSPRLGVYAVRISSEGKSTGLPAVANFGLRPTVEDARVPRLEVHVLGECPFATGDAVTVELKHFLRPEMKFGSVGELTQQIARDREAATIWFSHQ